MILGLRKTFPCHILIKKLQFFTRKNKHLHIFKYYLLRGFVWKSFSDMDPGIHVVLYHVYNTFTNRHYKPFKTPFIPLEVGNAQTTTTSKRFTLYMYTVTVEGWSYILKRMIISSLNCCQPISCWIYNIYMLLKLI